MVSMLSDTPVSRGGDLRQFEVGKVSVVTVTSIPVADCVVNMLCITAISTGELD